MARLPEELITRIKQEVSLLKLVESQGYTVTKQGKDYAVHCPFHDDKTPSCIISPKTNLFHCFGCGEAGSVIDWVMKTQGVGFRHAVEILQNGNASSLAAHSSAVKVSTVPKLESPLSENANDQTVLTETLAFYHQTLKQSPEALEYLDKRGLNDPELINHFKLGYANRTLGLRLPKKNRKTGSQLREQLQRIGLYRETGREHFNGSIVIPVINGQGDITEVYGRKIRDDLRKGTPKHTYLPGPHSGVFNSSELINSEEIILCESLIDALTFWRWGFKHVTASFGTNGFTGELLQALLDNNVKRVLIAYDRDEAGNNAAEKLAKRLLENGIDCFRVLFPKGMDANDYALQVQPSQKSLALALRQAEWLGTGDVQGSTSAVGGRKPKTVKQPEITSVAEPSSLAAPLAASPSQAKTETNPGQPVIEPENPIDKQATPTPPAPLADVDCIERDNELHITLGDRNYRVRGFDQHSGHDQLKINLMVKRDEVMHLDKLDLYSSKQRQVFINQASVELGVKDEVIKKDLGKVLLLLEEKQSQTEEETGNEPVAIDDQDRQAALELLHDPDLLNRILTDFTQAGVVGEETNKLAGYLSCVSRKLDKPLAVIIQSSSAAGKSSLMESILALMPEEERVQYSAMTGQSLFYMGETNLKHKILAIAEEEGASNASYALKLLQSEGEVTIASTGKDDSTGNLVTKEYKVEGPVMLFLTTTAIDIDEELLNRCLVLTVNESREQTQAIHQAQRQKRTLQGLQNKLEQERIIKLHRNAQRLLKPLHVINPYADQLTFLDDKTRTRRDHEKYLTLIDTIALLHQYQREIKIIEHDGQPIEYVEVTLNDIETANRIARDVLGKTLDELPPQTRKLLTRVMDMVKTECTQQGIEQNHFRFSRRQVRQCCGWGETQTRLHTQRLVDMEYLLVHRGGRGQSFEYELLYNGEGDQGDLFLMGLLDTKQLNNKTTTATSRGKPVNLAASSRPQRGGIAPTQTPPQTTPHEGYREQQFDCIENTYLPVNSKTDRSAIAEANG